MNLALRNNKFIFFSGALSLIFYFGVALIVNIFAYLDARYVLITLPLLLVYFIYFIYYKKHARLSSEHLWGFSFLFLVTMVFAVPVIYTDFYHYFFEDVVLVFYNLNPYFITPLDLPQEPLSALSGWNFLPAQHGPLRSIMMAPVALLSGANVVLGLVLYKIFFAIFFLFSGALIYKISQLIKLPNPKLALYLFLWNPLIIFGTMVRGGTDILMVFWLLSALYFLFRNKFFSAIALFTLSFLLKYVTLIFLPFILVYMISRDKTLRQKMISLLKYLAIFFTISAVVSFPFWQGIQTLAGIRWVSQIYDANSFPGLVSLIYSFFYPGLELSSFRVLFESVFITVYLLLLYNFYKIKLPGPKDLLRYMFLVMASFLLLGKFLFLAKYLIWLLPLSILNGEAFNDFSVFVSGAVIVGVFSSVSIILLVVPATLIFSFYAYMTSPNVK